MERPSIWKWVEGLFVMINQKTERKFNFFMREYLCYNTYILFCYEKIKMG